MSDQRWADLVGAYVLDALEGEELASFEARLREDEELRGVVDEARASTLVLAESLPDLQPPPHLRSRVLDRMRAARSDDPPQSPGEGTGSANRFRSTAPWLLLAASVAGLLWLGNENRGLAERSATLEEQLESVRASLGDAQLALARFDSMAAALSGPNVQLATLTGDTEPTLRLVWNRDRDLLLVAAQNLPPLPEGRTFQLWGIRGDEAPVSLGTFETGPQGDALVTLPAGAADDYDVSAITEEPAGGSPQPTTTPFLVGAWNSAQ